MNEVIETVANKLSTGEIDVLTLTSHDRLAYVRAMEAIRPTGIPLEVAAIQFAEAVKLIGNGSILEAARFFAKHNSQFLPKKQVAELVAELIEAKRVDGMSGAYLRDLRGRLGRFERAFKLPISMVTIAEIEDFLRSLGLSGRSRNNFRQRNNIF